MDDFLSRGWEKTDFSSEADVYLINTCTVTNRTDFKSRNAIRKALKMKELYPQAKVVVTGCYTQRNEEDVRKLGNIDLVIDNNKKNLIYKAVTEDFVPEFQDIIQAIEYSEHSTGNMPDRSRAFIKIQDGCNFFCAYCAVAWARGPSRSRQRENILAQVQQLVTQGFREFVISGINLGLYGYDQEGDYHLENLLADMDEIKGVEKIRISSLEPQLFNESVLQQIARSKKICPHFHIPLQTGSDVLLHSMGRHYTIADFKEILHKILQIMPDAALGLDVITGLPGETDAIFTETYRFLQELPIAYLHVFPFSRRPGTKAWSMPQQINGTIIKARVDKLLQLSLTKKDLYMNRLIKDNIILSGSVENRQDGYYTLLSDHYVRAYFEVGNSAAGDLVKGRSVGVFRDGVLLEMCL